MQEQLKTKHCQNTVQPKEGHILWWDLYCRWTPTNAWQGSSSDRNDYTHICHRTAMFFGNVQLSLQVLSQNGRNQWSPVSADLQRHPIHMGTWTYWSLPTAKEGDLNSTSTAILWPKKACCPANRCMYQRARSCPPARWTSCVFCIQVTDNCTTKLCSYRAWSSSCFMGSPEVSFMLQTDHKPLQAILSKSLVEATPQMQRLLLPTIPYDMTVEYIKGETNFIADCLSRAPVAEDTIKLPILQVNQITTHARCTQDRIDRLQ